MKVRVALLSGEKHDLTIINPSMVAYDRTRGKRDWPSPKEAPIFWMTFLTWHTAKAHGIYEGKFDDWADRDCIELDDLEDDSEPDPTRSDREHD